MAKLTGRERVFSKGEHLISTTDRHGTITYANQSFADIAGYQQQELLGLQHNVVRHPSMPKAAFGELWSHLKQGKSWMGMVCNRSKNGDHYWVDAYVTPVYKNGHVEGYQSVRVKPDNEHLNTAQKLYKKITTASAISNALSNFSLTMVGKIMLAYLLSMVPVFIISIESASKESLPTVIGAMVFSVIFAYIAARLIQLPYKRATDKTRSIFDSEIARKVYTKRNDELGQLQLTIKVLQAEIETILSRVGGTADELNKVTATTSNEVDKTNASVLQQRIELESVSTAVHEMSATIEEVARNTVQTSDSAQQAEQEVVDGYAVVDETVASIENLAQQVQQAASVISKLQEDSDAIGSVIGVIRSIAEQTNLLALNAAIEAARAGEQGRGFAVVADEVRTLASQTQESTEKIETIIARLQQSTSEAVEEMVAGQDKAIGCVDQAERAGEALQAIGKAVAVIKDMTMQNASASEQQSVVAEEINRNINQISHVANETSEASETTAKATDNLVNQVMNMRDMIQQFKR